MPGDDPTKPRKKSNVSSSKKKREREAAALNGPSLSNLSIELNAVAAKLAALQNGADAAALKAILAEYERLNRQIAEFDAAMSEEEEVERREGKKRDRTAMGGEEEVPVTKAARVETTAQGPLQLRVQVVKLEDPDSKLEGQVLTVTADWGWKVVELKQRLAELVILPHDMIALTSDLSPSFPLSLS